VPRIPPRVAPDVPILPKVVRPEVGAELSARLGAHSELLEASAGNRNLRLLLELAEAPRPADLPQVVRLHLEGVTGQVKSLKNLAKLQEHVRFAWPKEKPPDDLKILLDSLGESPETARLVPRLQKYLTCRAVLEGRPDLAAKLGGRVAGDGGDVLRDLKALPAEVTEDLPATLAASPELPLPEQPLSPPQAVKESLHADLPELLAAEVQARRAVLKALNVTAELHWNKAAISLHLVRSAAGLHSPARRDDPDGQEGEEEVESRLGRPLLPAERLLARRLLRNRTPADVAAVLREVAKD
jgi:hypothetical protein